VLARQLVLLLLLLLLLLLVLKLSALVPVLALPWVPTNGLHSSCPEHPKLVATAAKSTLQLLLPFLGCGHPLGGLQQLYWAVCWPALWLLPAV
jgi:hypothetical protein